MSWNLLQEHLWTNWFVPCSNYLLLLHPLCEVVYTAQCFKAKSLLRALVSIKFKFHGAKHVVLKQFAIPNVQNACRKGS